MVCDVPRRDVWFCGLPVRATRIKRGGEDEYALNRFAPLLYDILSDMGAGRLSQDDFPYVRWVR